MRRVGVLCSGGLDSLALVANYLRQPVEIWPVYVKSGLPWERAEIASAARFLERVACARLKPISFATLKLELAYETNWSRTGRTPSADSDDADVFLPARNLLLATKCMLTLSSVGVFDLAIATLKGNPFPDATPGYFRLLEKVLGRGFRRRVQIHSPFRRKSKSDVIRELGEYPLHLSMSCIGPRQGLHCGKCNKCAERKRAFRKAGVSDLTDYWPGSTVRRSS